MTPHLQLVHRISSVTAARARGESTVRRDAEITRMARALGDDPTVGADEDFELRWSREPRPFRYTAVYTNRKVIGCVHAHSLPEARTRARAQHPLATRCYVREA